MSLTTTSKTFRKGVILLLIIGVLYYIYLLFLAPAGKALYLAIFPPSDPATHTHGMLPPLEFEDKVLKNTEPPTYTLDTKTGRLPKDLPWKMTVYTINKVIPSFEKGKDASRTAEQLGFYEKDLVSSLKDEVYEWKKIESGGELKITTTTKEIELNTPLEGKSDNYPRNELNDIRAKQIAKEILVKTGRLTDELYKNGEQKVVLGRFVNDYVVKTDTIADAQIARVDFFRTIDEYPIVGPDPREGLINITLRDPGEARKLKENPYLNFPIMETHERTIKTQSNATYEISSVSDVWKVIKSNKGVIASVTPDNSSNLEKYTPVAIDDIYVNNIYLAYYEDTKYQQFLQPVYVFEGKYSTAGTGGGEIIILYPAIKPEWIKKVD